MGAFEPRITVSSLESEGVVLLSYGHPNFGRVFPEQKAPEYDALLPYTVIIWNDTDREITAYSVVWYSTAPDGLVTKKLRTTLPGVNLRPDSTQVVSLMLTLETGGLNVDPSTENAIRSLVAFFSKQAAVRISLEAALFDDGTAIGPDSEDWLTRWKAELDAEKHVFTVATSTPASEVRAVLGQLAEPAITLARRQSDFQGRGQLPTLAERSTDYAECLELMKGYFALSVLDELEENRRPVLENIRMILKSKRYPNVHGKQPAQ